MTNARGIEIERKAEIGIQPHQRPNERSEADHDPDQSGDGQETKPALKLVQPGHCWRTVMSRSSRARWIALSPTR